MKHVFLSLIFPVYNEQTRLLPGIRNAISYLKKQSYTWEIILVDDGSTIPIKQRGYPIHIIRLPRNKGKGAAIARGVEVSRGTYIVFSDIDLSVPIETLSSVLGMLATHAMVIASRRLPQSQIARHQPIVREIAGRVFTFLSNTLCGIDVADATCGFKGYQAPVAKQLFSRSHIARWVFDTEILFLARKRNIPIVELPVVWKDAEGSTVRSIDVVGSFIDLLRIGWYNLVGSYK